MRQCLKDKARRYRVEKWFWMTHIPAVAYLTLFQKPLWETVSLPYVAILSIYALVITAGGAEQAAEAAENSKSSSPS
jgi:hypothetical protein